jgi:hypothetical protein
VDDAICYLNTDFELVSPTDLKALAAAFEAQGVRPRHVTRGKDGLYYSMFNTVTHYDQPEPNIGAMVSAAESLEEDLRIVWSGCVLREFNIGYDCGSKPWAFTQGLSSHLLGRMAAVGASLRVTLYPIEKHCSLR